MTEYTMRVYYEVLGGHTHLHIFTGPRNGQLGKAGVIIMTNEEFESWKNGAIQTVFCERVAV